MSESSTETESLSGREEEMAMMSITDVFPVGKNMDKDITVGKNMGKNMDKAVGKKMDKVVGKDMDKVVGKNMDEVVGCKKGSVRIGGKKEEEVIVARAKGFLSCNGFDDAAGKTTCITRCEGEPEDDFASAELPLKKFASAELPVKKELPAGKEGRCLTLQEQLMILRKEQCR